VADKDEGPLPAAKAVTESTPPQQPSFPAPGLITDIEAIRQQIRETELTRQAARKEVTEETVKQIWEEYAEYNPSKSIQTTLKTALLSLDGRIITCRVPAQIAKDMILQESPLLERLREQTGIENLVFNVEVDKAAFPDIEEVKPVVAMTQKERYMYMLEQQPALGVMVQKLGLKLDKDV